MEASSPHHLLKKSSVLILILRVCGAFLLRAPLWNGDISNMHEAPSRLRDPRDWQDSSLSSVEETDGPFTLDDSVVRKEREAHVKKILVPTDFSPYSAGAVDRGVALANQCNAALTILHVIDINSRADSGTAEELMRNLWGEGRRQIGQLIRSLPSQIEAQPMLAEGLPWEVIVEKSQDFDLLVLSQDRSQKGWNLFSQHTARRVIEHSACPVIVVSRQSDKAAENACHRF
jgi:nucleotide-binding universal stress UspA family protein